MAQQSCTSMESPPATDIEFPVFSTHASTTEPTAEANQRLADWILEINSLGKFVCSGDFSFLSCFPGGSCYVSAYRLNSRN